MKINDIAKEAYATATSKGFYENAPHVPERLCLIHSEVSEADEAFRGGETDLTFGAGGKPLGLPSELADIVIRVGDASAWLGFDLEEAVSLTRKQTLTPRGAAGFDRLCLIHSAISQTLEFFRDGENELREVDGKRIGVPAGLGMVVNHVYDFAFVMGIDLSAAIEAKMAYNKTRPHKHGRKVL